MFFGRNTETFAEVRSQQLTAKQILAIQAFQRLQDDACQENLNAIYNIDHAFEQTLRAISKGEDAIPDSAQAETDLVLDAFTVLARSIPELAVGKLNWVLRSTSSIEGTTSTCTAVIESLKSTLALLIQDPKTFSLSTKLEKLNRMLLRLETLINNTQVSETQKHSLFIVHTAIQTAIFQIKEMRTEVVVGVRDSAISADSWPKFNLGGNREPMTSKPLAGLPLVEHDRLQMPNEDDLRGKGVSEAYIEWALQLTSRDISPSDQQAAISDLLDGLAYMLGVNQLFLIQKLNLKLPSYHEQKIYLALVIKQLIRLIELTVKMCSENQKPVGQPGAMTEAEIALAQCEGGIKKLIATFARDSEQMRSGITHKKELTKLLNEMLPGNGYDNVLQLFAEIGTLLSSAQTDAGAQLATNQRMILLLKNLIVIDAKMATYV